MDPTPPPERLDYPGHPPFLSAAADRLGLRAGYNDALRQPALGQVSNLAAQAAEQLPRLRAGTMARARLLAEGLALAAAAAADICDYIDPTADTDPDAVESRETKPRRVR